MYALFKFRHKQWYLQVNKADFEPKCGYLVVIVFYSFMEFLMHE
jgi:hypothetical protein